MTRSPRDLANQKIQLRKQQEKLFTDLLTIVDALDRAAEHWQQVMPSSTTPSSPAENKTQPAIASPSPPWQEWSKCFFRLLTSSMTHAGLIPKKHRHQAHITSTGLESASLEPVGLESVGLESAASESNTLAEVITSAHDGIEMIRQSMLSVLSQHQVEPLLVKGKPFDPGYMHALGQQVDREVPPQTVVQEVVRGYRWQDRTLREAQVIVAISAPQEDLSIS